MTDFVLVHGGWHGGWVWRDVALRLQQSGHAVFTPTLSGLGERRHLIDAVTGPDVHVEDICNVIQYNELSDVVLVGHSYAGLVITGVATRMEKHIAELVYLDALVPIKPNEAPLTLLGEERADEFKALFDEMPAIPPTGFHRWVSDSDTQAWLQRMTTPQPTTCWTNGVSEIVDPAALNLGRTYILCKQHSPSPFEKVHARYRNDPQWQCHTLNCLHDAMLEKPRELVALLENLKSQH